MATDSTAPAIPTSNVNPAWGITWAGVMLLVLALWLRAKFDDLSFVLLGAVALLGVLGVAFGFWQLIQTLRQPPLLELAEKRRAQAGLFCMVGGVAQIALAVALGFTLRLPGFGEYVGLALFGLAALACGKALLAKGPMDSTLAWNRVQSQLGVLKLALFVLGAGGVIAFLWLALGVKLGASWFPELAALLTGGFFFLATAFWLQMQTATGEIPLVRLRLFILLLGGVSGFIVTVMILLRIYLWRNEVFLGGLDIWLGEGSWRLWMCAYVLLAGLGFMFASLLLARADIHESATLRRSLFGYNALLNGILLLATLILANILFYILVPYTINWSRTSFSTLAPATKNLLAGLKEPTTFYVIMSESQASDLRPVLDNCRVENSKINVVYISPERDEKRYFDLAERYKEITPERTPFGGRPKRGVLVIYGTEPTGPNQPIPPHAFVPDNKIFESKSDDPHGMPPQMRGKGKTTLVFKAEPEIMRELHHLSAGKQKRKLYVLQGNGELDVNNQNVTERSFNEPLSQYGMGKLVERLKKEEYEVQGLRFTPRLKKEENVVAAPETGPDKKKEIPDDAFALVIPGPSETMSKETLDALERYIDKGGRLVAFFETVFDEKYTKLQSSGLEDFLKKYGVEVRLEYAITPQARDMRTAWATAPDKAETLLAKQFTKMKLGLYTARQVKAMPSSGRFKADVLFQLDATKDDFWFEDSSLPVSNLDAYIQQIRKNQQAFIARIEQNSVPVAVTVSEGAGDLAKPRMVIFGDTDFVINSPRNPAGFQDLVVSSLEWMAEKQGYVGPRPRETPSYNVPTTMDGTRLFLYPGLLMMLAITGLGVGLWLVRRR